MQCKSMDCEKVAANTAENAEVNSECKNAVITQICFRQKVLCQNYTDSSVFVVTRN